ncbi:hypothetical protein [Micromonospora sp. MH33]|uniref:hypothetical protein n=1 Tax=Micromonospora sp. MH33 TaxID=1945509 RepID=UPI001FEE86EA|nr:hypothetical protein [Micromonospora sp. MH33]
MTRWVARTLASLAVLVACSFGAATLPVGGAATAPVAAPAVASVESLTLRTADQDLRDAADRTSAVAGAGQNLRGGAADRQAVPVGGPGPVAATQAVVRPADRPLALTGLVPATVGSRAPPAR